MPYGVYKTKGREDVRIFYSACEDTLRKFEDGENLLKIFNSENDAKFFAKVEEERIKYKGNVGPIEEGSRA